MSKFRTLIPEQDPVVTTSRMQKLEKALILCELIDYSFSKRSIMRKEDISFLSDIYGKSLEKFGEKQYENNHFLEMGKNDKVKNLNSVKYL